MKQNKSDEADKDAPSINYDITVQKENSLLGHQRSCHVQDRVGQHPQAIVHTESMRKSLEIIKQLDKKNGYVNCTGNNVTANQVCDCASEESENTTNDVIEILVATTMPPVVQIGSTCVDGTEADSMTIRQNGQEMEKGPIGPPDDSMNKIDDCEEPKPSTSKDNDTSIWMEEKL